MVKLSTPYAEGIGCGELLSERQRPMVRGALVIEEGVRADDRSWRAGGRSGGCVLALGSVRLTTTGIASFTGLPLTTVLALTLIAILVLLLRGLVAVLVLLFRHLVARLPLLFWSLAPVLILTAIAVLVRTLSGSCGRIAPSAAAGSRVATPGGSTSPRIATRGATGTSVCGDT